MPRRRPSLAPSVSDILHALEALATPKDLTNLQRFGITATQPLGVSMVHIKAVARQVGRDHRTAAALWASDIYEARLLAAHVEEASRVTPAQMDRWARDFDNWAVCDTLCFALFDRSPHAWGRVDAWAMATPRDLVRKGVSWALRTTGRRSAGLHAEALAVAQRLAASSDAGRRWVGRDAVRELTGPIVARPLQRRAAKKR